MNMTDAQVRLFEEGWLAYANGMRLPCAPSHLNAKERRWWLKGYDASRESNELLAQQWGLAGGGV